MGFGRERAGDADALFLSAGKLGGVVVGAFGQADDFKAFFDAFFDFFRRPSGDFQRKGNIVGDGTVAQKIKLLKHHADILPRLTQCGGIKRGQFLSAHIDLAAVGTFQQVNQAQQGGFARTGIAHQTEDFAVLDFEAGRLDGGKTGFVARLVMFGNVVQNNHKYFLILPEKKKPDAVHNGLGYKERNKNSRK